MRIANVKNATTSASVLYHSKILSNAIAWTKREGQVGVHAWPETKHWILVLILKKKIVKHFKQYKL